MATIKQNYLNQTYSGSYGGLSGFVKNRTKWKDKDQVAKELRKLRGYALHGDVRYKFPRRKIMVNFINEMWASDLKALSVEDARVNKVNFLLVVVDALSKKGYIRALKDKTSASMIRAFKSIIKEAGTSPLTLFTDRGSEYLSSDFKAFLKEKKIVWRQIYDGKYWEAANAKAFGVQAIPFTLLIGKDGKIAAVKVGGEELAPAIEAALKKP